MTADFKDRHSSLARGPVWRFFFALGFSSADELIAAKAKEATAESKAARYRLHLDRCHRAVCHINEMHPGMFAALQHDLERELEREP